jgi:hypothetical protein
VLKAAVKGLLFYLLYYVCWLFLAPLAGIIPSLQKTIETFAIIYIALVVASEIVAGTIYQHFFSIANDLFVISYLVFCLNSGVISINYQNVLLQIDTHLLLGVAMILALLGLCRSVLQTINFASRKAENSQAQPAT